MSFLNELKRRNVLKVATAYIVSSWLLIQVSETIFPLFGFGDTPARLVVIVLAIAFIPSLILSWVFEITPEGLKRDADVDHGQSGSKVTSKKLDRVILVVLALALAYFTFDKFVLVPARVAEIVEETTQRVRSDALVESYGDKSIAVLPFVNMSDDASNEYFSDGISEELLNLLVRVPELRVISRSSAFSYKGKDKKLTEVAKELNAAHVLEGSVRKAGNQVRITAQLIEARSDTHLWSVTYDRSLDDIFAIQDEIASKVVAQLKVTLLGDMPTVKKTNPEAYALYLQARHLFGLQTVEALEQAIFLYQQVLEIDPGYAAAWSGLSAVYVNQVEQNLRPRDEGMRLGREALNRALALDPENGFTYSRLSNMEHQHNLDLDVAAKYMTYALELDPGNTDILRSASWLAWSLGHLDESIMVNEYVVEQDPLNPVSYYSLGLSHLWAGHLDEAISAFRAALMLSPGHFYAHYRAGIALLLKGELQAALEEVQLEKNKQKSLEGKAIVFHALGQEQASDAALAELIAQYGQRSAYNVAYVLASRNEADRAFIWLEKALLYSDNGFIQIALQPEFANIHNDPRWVPFLEKIGMLPEQLSNIEFKIPLPE
ncbi:MAG: tetratricopeptide repeat protein [Xanthomonadales bacterium]|nr:tetratricopeptide repeat protein [Xanthomonadales bacterium]